ncbi:testis-expressed protein 10 homolog [Oratosquilla oratoria]|uniref:testis-expressed protein 10 homolog n=1 Tax=Oratosquilla oratoria TaxID=337810 RepID=UPI003F764B3A
MGRSAKAKKAKKADFAKVKLKVGKKLKKADNETRTDFKARKIIIKEQFADKSSENLVTKKNHTLKELLSRLHHQSVYVRQDGLNGLRQLVQNNRSDILSQQLSSIVSAAAPTILDTDGLIRGTGRKLITDLLLKVISEIEPHLHILASHLSCALVHINTNVQADALDLVNIMVTHAPGLVAKHANVLLGNFLSLISKKVNNPQTSVPKVKKVDFSSLIMVSPENKLSSTKWRLKLLQEMGNFLRVILAEEDKCETAEPISPWQTILRGSLAQVQWSDQLVNNVGDVKILKDEDELQNFCSSLVPLLFAMWAEITQGTMLTAEGKQMLQCMLELLEQIWNLTRICTQKNPAQCKWLQDLLTPAFQQRVMIAFPYSQHCDISIGKKNKKRRSVLKEDEEMERSSEEECHELNVSLLHMNLRINGQKSIDSSLINYVQSLLSDPAKDGQYSMYQVVLMAKTILGELSKSSNDQEILEGFLASIRECFCRLHSLSKDKMQLLELLDIALDMNHRRLWSLPAVEGWSSDIVNELSAQPARSEMISCALQLRLRNAANIKPLLLRKNEFIKGNLTSRGVLGMDETQLETALNRLLSV